MRWFRFVGQLGGLARVYSSALSCGLEASWICSLSPLYRADKSAIMGTKTGLDRRSPLQLAVE